MRRDLLTYLEDINLAVSDIEDFVKGRSLAEYTSDRMLQSAVERKFILVGEAFAQMEQHFPGDRQRIHNVRNIVAFRNLLVHQYDAIDIEEVFTATQAPMLLLKTEVNAWIAELDPSAKP